MMDSVRQIICLNCGYDLRAATTNLCSECGKPFDRETYHRSHFPAESPGHFKFIRTLLVLLFARKLAFEAYRDHDLKKAIRFRRFNHVLLFAAAAVLLYFTFSHLKLNLADEFKNGAMNNFQKQELFDAFNNPPKPKWCDGLLLDYQILMTNALRGILGIILQGVLFFMLIRDWVHAPSGILSRQHAPPDFARQSIILGCYASGFYCVFLAIALAGLIIQSLFSINYLPSLFYESPADYLSIIHQLNGLHYFSLFLFAASLLFPGALLLFRLAQWRRILHDLPGNSMLTTPFVVLWTFLWRTLFWLFFIPFFVGLFRLILKF